MNGKTYTLKGYKLFIKNLTPGDKYSKQTFIQFLVLIIKICEEYFFLKFASMLSINFAKPLIACIEAAKDKYLHSYLFIEIIFEDSGKPLDEVVSDIGVVYNLIRQSDSTLSLLHELELNSILEKIMKNHLEEELEKEFKNNNESTKEIEILREVIKKLEKEFMEKTEMIHESEKEAQEMLNVIKKLEKELKQSKDKIKELKKK